MHDQDQNQNNNSANPPKQAPSQLVVKIINPKAIKGATKISHNFGIGGGSLGSDAASDWVINEVGENQLDQTHVTFTRIEGSLCLMDQSRAGVLINGAASRPEPGQPVRLSHGDRFQIGGLQFAVELTAAVDDPFMDEAQHAEDLTAITGINPYRQVAPGSASSAPMRDNPLLAGGDPADVNELRPEPSVSAKTLTNDPLAVFGDSEAQMRTETDPLALFDRRGIGMAREHSQDDLIPKTDQQREAAADLPESQRDLIGTMGAAANPGTLDGDVGMAPGGSGGTHDLDQDAMAYLSQLDAADVGVASSSHGTTDGQAAIDHVALRPLLKALGLNLGEMSADEADLFLTEVGMVLRETVAAMVDMYSSATGAGPVESRLTATNIMPLEDNPMRMAQSVDEGMENLFFIQNPVQLSPSDAIRECFAQLKDHQKFTESAADQGLEASLKVFDPAILTQRFHAYAQARRDQRPRDAAWHWDMYQNYYRELQAKRQDGLRRIFWQVFERAYDQKARNQPSIF